MARPAGTAVEEVVMFSRVPVSGCVAVTDNGLGKMTQYAKVERVYIYMLLLTHIGPNFGLDVTSNKCTNMINTKQSNEQMK